MPTTRTESDLAYAVLEDLNLLGVGQTLSNSDREFVVSRYRNMMAEMRDERTPYWPDATIPLEAFEGLVALMGLVVGKAFGLPGQSGEEYNNSLDAAKRRLRKLVAKPASGTPDDPGYF